MRSGKEIGLKWSTKMTLKFIESRTKNEDLFTGKRNAAVAGYSVVLEEIGLDYITTDQAKKKWDNLVRKYKDILNQQSGYGTSEGELAPPTWPYFEAMDKSLSKKNNIIPLEIVDSVYGVKQKTSDHSHVEKEVFPCTSSASQNGAEKGERSSKTPKRRVCIEQKSGGKKQKKERDVDAIFLETCSDIKNLVIPLEIVDSVYGVKQNMSDHKYVEREASPCTSSAAQDNVEQRERSSEIPKRIIEEAIEQKSGGRKQKKERDIDAIFLETCSDIKNLLSSMQETQRELLTLVRESVRKSQNS